MPKITNKTVTDEWYSKKEGQLRSISIFILVSCITLIVFTINPGEKAAIDSLKEIESLSKIINSIPTDEIDKGQLAWSDLYPTDVKGSRKFDSLRTTTINPKFKSIENISLGISKNSFVSSPREITFGDYSENIAFHGIDTMNLDLLRHHTISQIIGSWNYLHQFQNPYIVVEGKTYIDNLPLTTAFLNPFFEHEFEEAGKESVPHSLHEVVIKELVMRNDSTGVFIKDYLSISKIGGKPVILHLPNIQSYQRDYFVGDTIYKASKLSPLEPIVGDSSFSFVYTVNYSERGLYSKVPKGIVTLEVKKLSDTKLLDIIIENSGTLVKALQFSEAFPNLSKLSESHKNLNINGLREIFEMNLAYSKTPIDMGGVSISQGLVMKWGPFVVLILQAYLYAHLFSLMEKRPDSARGWVGHWIGSQDDYVSKFITIANIVLLPSLTVLLCRLTLGWVGGVISFSWLSFLIFAAALFMSLATYRILTYYWHRIH